MPFVQKTADHCSDVRKKAVPLHRKTKGNGSASISPAPQVTHTFINPVLLFKVFKKLHIMEAILRHRHILGAAIVAYVMGMMYIAWEMVR